MGFLTAGLGVGYLVMSMINRAPSPEQAALPLPW